MPKRTYRLRTKLLAAAFAVLFLLLLAEAALQVIGYDPRPEAEFGELADSRAYSPHPRYLWTLRPNSFLRAPDLGLLDVRVTSRGLRGPESPVGGQPDELRVLCLGDSITFGLGLENGSTWPDATAQLLRARLARPVVVVNGALPGWSTVQGMRLFRDLSREARYDFVVFWFGMNDSKPANAGLPDRWYRWEASAGERDLLSWSRVALLLRYAVRGVASAGGAAGHRVSPEDFTAATLELVEGGKAGGPEPVFVRSPEQLDKTIREFEAMTSQARELGLSRLSGPKGLFNPYGPFLRGAPPVGRKVSTNLGPALHFGGPAEGRVHAELAEVESLLEMLRDWKETLDRYARLLPEASLSAADLLGPLPGPQAFTDNCHLSPPGAAAAGRAIGEEILRRLGR